MNPCHHGTTGGIVQNARFTGESRKMQIFQISLVFRFSSPSLGMSTRQTTNRHPNTMKLIPAVHTSPETAYVIQDYPYGFRLRCTMRVWVEEKGKQGFRVVSQTTNPKKPGTVWNAPKASTYTTFGRVLFLDENGHLQNEGIHGNESYEKIVAALEKYQGHLYGEASLRQMLPVIKKMEEKLSAIFSAR